MLFTDLKDHRNYVTFNKEVDDSDYYYHITAATESGWDFSSRWREYKSKYHMYGFLQTHNVIPVDLNSILVKNARILAKYHRDTENPSKAKYFENLATNRAKAIDKIMWDEKCMRWRDVIIGTPENKIYTYEQKKDTTFYHSDLHPLYMDIVNDPENAILTENENLM